MFFKIFFYKNCYYKKLKVFLYLYSIHESYLIIQSIRKKNTTLKKFSKKSLKKLFVNFYL